MEQFNNANLNDANHHTASAPTVEVLYQKLGKRWHAFSLVNDDVFVGSLSQEEIDGTNTASSHVTHQSPSA